MAKDQKLSLNSVKISGPCGRLLCCLFYEYGFYSEQQRNLPQEGMRITHNNDCHFERVDNYWKIKG
jgi:cell fate regulator YaaT (PSP1 superfamily)